MKEKVYIFINLLKKIEILKRKKSRKNMKSVEASKVLVFLDKS